MKIYAIHYNQFIDGEYESGIFDNKFYVNEVDAYDKMMKEAQLIKNDWNSNNGNFNLNTYPKCCSITAEYESDYMEISIVELED